MPFVAVAAIAAGAAVATGVVAASTVAMIGIGATVVGKITKSKELSQIGAGLSLGAGVASIASSVFGGTSAAAGTAEAATAGTGSAAEAVPGVDATAGLGQATEAGGSAANALESASSVTGNTGGILNAESATGQTAGLAENAGSAASEPALATSRGGILNSPLQSQPLSATPQASVAPDSTALNGGIGTSPITGVSSIAPPVGTDSNSIAQWWEKQSDAVKNRIMQTGAQAVGGLFEGWTAEQKMALERERLNLEKQKQQTSIQNANAQPKVAFQPYTAPTRGILTAKG